MIVIVLLRGLENYNYTDFVSATQFFYLLVYNIEVQHHLSLYLSQYSITHFGLCDPQRGNLAQRQVLSARKFGRGKP